MKENEILARKIRKAEDLVSMKTAERKESEKKYNKAGKHE